MITAKEARQKVDAVQRKQIEDAIEKAVGENESHCMLCMSVSKSIVKWLKTFGYKVEQNCNYWGVSYLTIRW